MTSAERAGRDREQGAPALSEASGVRAELLAWHRMDQSTAADVMDTLQLGLLDLIRL